MLTLTIVIILCVGFWIALALGLIGRVVWWKGSELRDRHEPVRWEQPAQRWGYPPPTRPPLDQFSDVEDWLHRQ
jgi:hypothetical protein